METWDRNKLESYISKWPELERDIVFKQILDATFLRNALDTEKGRALLQDAVKIVADKAMEVVALCCDFDKNIEGIRQAGIEVRTSLELLKRWAIILTTDDEHKRKAN